MIFVQTLNMMLKQMETKVRELESDLQRVKKLTALLLEENNALRSVLAHVYGQKEETEDKSKDEAHGGAWENLKRLYEKGFHVCNVRFGSIRKEECLFCVSLLERTGAEKGRASVSDTVTAK